MPSPSSPPPNNDTHTSPAQTRSAAAHQRSLYLDGLRLATVAGILALIALGLAWELWLAPLRPGGSFMALKVLPLCWPVAGLLKHRLHTYRALSLFIWLYFTEGVVRGTSDTQPSAALAWGQTGLCVLLFVLCVLYIRLRLQQPRHTA